MARNYTATVLRIVDSTETTDKVLDILGNPDTFVIGTWNALEALGLAERTCDLIMLAYAAGRNFENAQLEKSISVSFR